jgi:hypothetical protein
VCPDARKAEATWTESYAEALKLLDSIPLDTGEFAIDQQHLRNALDYCVAEELGGAEWLGSRATAGELSPIERYWRWGPVAGLLFGRRLRHRLSLHWPTHFNYSFF